MADRRRDRISGKAPPAAQNMRPGGIAPLDFKNMDAASFKRAKSGRSGPKVLDEKTLSKMDTARATKRLQRWQKQAEGGSVGLGFFEETKLSLISLKKKVFGSGKAPPPWIVQGREAIAKLSKPWKQVPPPDTARSKMSTIKKKKKGKRRVKGAERIKKTEKKVVDNEVKPQVTEMEIPTTVFGLVTLSTRVRIAEFAAYFRSRVEYARRNRALNGPSTIELILQDIIVKPFLLVWVELSYFLAAYIRVDDAFNVQRARIKRKRGQLIDIEDLECVTWHTLEALKERITAVIGFITVFSIMIGVAINELNFRGFIPRWAQDCANPAADADLCFRNPCIWMLIDDKIEEKPRLELECPNLPVVSDPLFQYLKLFSSLLTVLLLYSIYISYRYDANILSLRNHVEFNNKGLEKSWLHRAGLLHLFVAEVLLCCVHQLPFLQFDIVVDTLVFSDLPSVYTSDSALGVFLFLRVYNIWRWFKLRTFRNYDSRAYAVRLTEEPMNHLLAIKLRVQDSPFSLLAGSMAIIILSTSYVYRVVESSQNYTMSIYYWDALWFSTDTVTGLSFADPRIYPRSVLGRVVAVVTRLLGMLWTALAVTALKEWLKFGSFEIHALRWLELQRMTDVRKTSAARCIQYMWLYGLNHWSTLRQLQRFRIASGKLRLFSSSHRLPEATNFDMFVQSALTSKHQVSMLVEKQAALFQQAMTSVKTPKKTQTARKALTQREKDEPKAAKTARFSATDVTDSKTRVGASGKDFGSHTSMRGDANFDLTLPGEVADSSPHKDRCSTQASNMARFSNRAHIRGTEILTSEVVAVRSTSGHSNQAWVSGHSFGSTRRPDGSRRGSLNSARSFGSAASDDGSAHGSEERDQVPAMSRRPSIYKQDASSRPFTETLTPKFRRTGSYVRTEATRKQKRATNGLLSQALFSAQEDNQYKLVINRKEQDVMKMKELKKQAEDVVTIVEHLRTSSNALLDVLGYEPERARMWWEKEEAKVQAQWERDWDRKLRAIENKLQTLDQNLMATLGQIVLLVQGLYDARRNKVMGNDQVNDEAGGET